MDDANHRNTYGMIFAWCAILAIGSVSLLASGIAARPLDAFDDASYADVSKNIIKTGEWLNFYWLDGSPFLEKPPLQFWITALLFELFGISELSARLFPVFCGIGTLLAVMLLARRFLSRPASCLAGLALLCFPVFYEYSTKAMLDIPVTFLITLSILSFHQALDGRRYSHFFYGLTLGFAVLIKSIVGLVPLLVSAVFLLLKKPDKNIVKNWWLGNAVAAALILPWHIYEWVHYGSLFLREYFLYHIVQRMAGDIGYHSGKSAWFYLTEMSRANHFWVAIVLAVTGVLIRAIFYQDSNCRLLLVWMTAILAPISVSAVKLSWYTVPLYAPFALSIAATSDWLIKSVSRRAIATILLAAAAAGAVWTGYEFRQQKAMFLSEENSLVQLRNLLRQFRASSSPQDLIHIYDVGEAVPLTCFYADRPIQYLFSDAGTLAVQQKIPSNYLGKGIVRMVSEIGGLETVMLREGGIYLLPKNEFSKLQSKRVSSSTLGESRDFILLRCQLKAGG